MTLLENLCLVSNRKYGGTLRQFFELVKFDLNFYEMERNYNIIQDQIGPLTKKQLNKLINHYNLKINWYTIDQKHLQLTPKERSDLSKKLHADIKCKKGNIYFKNYYNDNYSYFYNIKDFRNGKNY